MVNFCQASNSQNGIRGGNAKTEEHLVEEIEERMNMCELLRHAWASHSTQFATLRWS